MRVYVPLTLPALKEAYEAGESGPDSGPAVAYAVTPGLREWCATEDPEELEYAALGTAARASLRLLASGADAPGRRVVLALDVPDSTVSAGTDSATSPASSEPGEVQLTGPVRLTHVAAVHVDADDAEPDVMAAAAALAAAETGEAEAQSTVDRAEDHELLWFATQEIPGLLG